MSAFSFKSSSNSQKRFQFYHIPPQTLFPPWIVINHLDDIFIPCMPLFMHHEKWKCYMKKMNLWNLSFCWCCFGTFSLYPLLPFPTGGFWCLKILLKHEKLWRAVELGVLNSLQLMFQLSLSLKYVYFLRVLGRWASCTHTRT